MKIKEKLVLAFERSIGIDIDKRDQEKAAQQRIREHAYEVTDTTCKTIRAVRQQRSVQSS